MPSEDEPPGLTLADVAHSLGVKDLDEVLVLRHTAQADGLRDLATASPEEVLAYTREQDVRSSVFPRTPPPLWLVFMEDGSHDGAHRARFYGAFENAGEDVTARTEATRHFDLAPSAVMASVKNRLVIDWTTPRVWRRFGHSAGTFRVLEIADPAIVPFPGFDAFHLGFAQLRRVLADPHYSRWHSALAAVRGVYLIVDSSTGKQYVGKADGAEGFLGRWRSYATDGHGGNVALRDLDELDLTHRQHFVFSILRVFGPEATRQQILTAEAHFKDALMTREFGYNLN